MYSVGDAVECYQCDSNEDGLQCPSNEYFDTNINAPVDCNGFDWLVFNTNFSSIS